MVLSVLPGSPGRATQNSISSISGMSRSLVSTCWTCHVGYHVISTHAHRLRLHGGACTTARSCTAVQRYPRTTVKFTAVRVRAAAALEHTPRAAKCRVLHDSYSSDLRPSFIERGVLVNQTRTRLSYCPCRLISPTLRRTKNPLQLFKLVFAVQGWMGVGATLRAAPAVLTAANACVCGVQARVPCDLGRSG